MKTIIVAVDFSNITTALINKTTDMAACLKARVYLIHVAAPDPEFVGYKVGPEHVREFRTSELKKEKKELEHYAEQLKKSGIDVIPLLIQGATAELILNETQRLEADLLIMGTHGHGVAVSALLGSTSHSVMKHVTCPVMLIPYKK